MFAKIIIYFSSSPPIMYPEILAILVTLIVGPLAFYIFSYTLYKKTKLKKFPVGINDGIGDIIFLPLFNAAFVHAGFSFRLVIATISLFLALALSSVYLIYSIHFASYTDWSKPRRHSYDLGGWYHLFFIFFQSAIIFYGLISYYDHILLWLPFLGYLLTAVYQIYSKRCI
jgi:hypothetical protein